MATHQKCRQFRIPRNHRLGDAFVFKKGDTTAPFDLAVLTSQQHQLQAQPLGQRMGQHRIAAEARDQVVKIGIAAYETTLQDEEFVASLQAQGVGTEWLGPERTTEIIEANFEILQRFQN